MKIRKNISIEEHILEKGLERAKELFGGNFSIYLAYLIQQDTNSLQSKEVEVKPKKSNLDQEVADSMDNILNM
ncbi:hypothetical protein GNF78_13420 [Clostridium perfringens]|uniref:hypothetical protein n=1 Tax=Clostridium perfringens TaxID=1502 RepID=UPI002AC37C51|nr:hypothetical protein [Clostridium perfringens]MDZ5038221.1 hypothetical protein [Clostridium perfringens]